MPPDAHRMCSGLGEAAAGTFAECGNVATVWRVIVIDHWAVRVFLCPAHDTLWVADVGPGNATRNRLSPR